MLIKLPDFIKSIYFVGDLHGNWELVKYYITNNHITDSVIFVCGDVGRGFNIKTEDIMRDYINKKLVLTNNYVMCVRGNHDNPDLFTDTTLEKNWLFIPDYSIINVCQKNILCVGGGISIDRTWRKSKGYGYWENEAPIYQPKVEERIDIICTHASPTFCYPFSKGQIVMDYATLDSTLLEDIQKERSTLELVYNDYQDTITHWYYGHYHQSNMQNINGVCFKLLGIGELCRHINDDNDFC